ncbi:MAG: CHASE2 domain-containing protein, partial [Bdellovibrionota bacterium]
MLSLSPRKIAGAFILFFLALIGVRHTFHFWQLIDSETSKGYEYEQRFDDFVPLLKWLERTDYDVHLRSHRHGKPNPNVGIIKIDEQSIQDIGQFPFARNVYVRLIERLKDAGASVVAFDMSFSEVERNEGVAELKKLKNTLPAGDQSIFRTINDRILKLDNDRLFSQEIAGHEVPVVIGFTFAGETNEAAKDLSGKEKLVMQRHAMRTSQVNAGNFAVTKTGFIPVLPHSEILDSLTKGSLGHFVPSADDDSVIREVPIVIEYQGGFYGSLALQAVGKYFNTGFTLSRENGLWINDDKGDIHIPLSRGQILPSYYGAGGFKAGEPHDFPYFEFVDILNGKVDANDLRGKILFVGATAVGLKDIRATPFAGDYPGVEVHATLASNILNGEYMVRDTSYFYVGYLFVLAFGLLASWIVFRFHPMISFLSSLAIITIMQFFAQRVYFDHGVVVPTFVPTLEMICITFSGILYRYFTEEKEKKFVRTAFSRYVSGDVVEELLKDQSKLQLGGQKKELTVMFSDLAGFTKLSEKMDAGFVTLLLNEYFTRMTEVIQKNHGTLDKYMGDGIMCFWGAPLNLPNHATHACQAALEMTQVLKVLNLEWKAKHGIVVGMRIGVHTGDMAVGNMGSEKVFSYTVMGDNVNLCSRLEGVNTVYGTEVIVSGETAQRAADSFIFRPLDIVKVKGKDESVKIFELVSD